MVGFRPLFAHPVAGKVMEKSRSLVGADRCSVFLVDHAHGQVVSKFLDGDSNMEIRVPIGRGIVGAVKNLLGVSPRVSSALQMVSALTSDRPLIGGIADRQVSLLRLARPSMSPRRMRIPASTRRLTPRLDTGPTPS